MGGVPKEGGRMRDLREGGMESRREYLAGREVVKGGRARTQGGVKGGSIYK